MRRAVVIALALAPACDPAPARCPPGELCAAIHPAAMTVSGADLATADLDGDGRRDLVTGGGLGVSVRWGAPDGPSPATLWPTPGTTARVRLGDVDGDGRVDIVALLTSGTVAWLPGAGARTFAPARAFATGATARAAALADVDGDGDDDLVLAEHDAAWLRVLPGGPDGPEAPRRVRIGGEAVALAAGDFTGDGAAEVVAAVPARGRVELLRGAAADPLTTATIARRSSFPQALAAADLDGDGALDLAVGDALDPSVWIARGDGRGGWLEDQVWPAHDAPVGLLARRGADGLELAVLAGDRRGVALLDPRAATLRAATRTQAEFAAAAALDLDGDGVDELIHGHAPPGTVREVDGFQAAPRWRWPLAGEAGLVAFADLDGDGARELVVETSSARRWWRSRPTVRGSSSSRAPRWRCGSAGWCRSRSATAARGWRAGRRPTGSTRLSSRSCLMSQGTRSRSRRVRRSPGRSPTRSRPTSTATGATSWWRGPWCPRSSRAGCRTRC